MQLMITLPNGEQQTIEARSEWTLMEAMRDAGLPVLAQCGGGCACATCHVHIAPAWRVKTGTASAEETELLTESPYYDLAASRLSCQIICGPDLDGLEASLQADACEN